MPRRKAAPLPPPGTAFAMTLPNGMTSICRVLRHSSAEEAKSQGCLMALVAGSAWVGTDLPDLEDPALREVLVLTHHAFKKERAVLWVNGTPPETYDEIGSLPPTDREAKQTCYSAGGWEWFQIQAFAQWQWTYERAVVLQEDAEKQAGQEAARADVAVRYQKYLAGLTLPKLRKKRWFSHWRPFVSVALVKESRAILVETIEDLMALGSEATVRQRIRSLRTCIHRFNTLDEQNDHFIATIEREDICEAFDEIVYVCGLHDCPDLAERWRDW